MRNWLKEWNLQAAVTAFCVLTVCIGTWQMQTVKWDTGRIEFFRDLLGVLMALILFTHYRWSDFLKYKKVYLLWTIVGGIGLAVGTPLAIAERHDFLVADTIVLSLGIFLMGYCVIHTIIGLVCEKKYPKLNKPLLFIWATMFVWMIFSKTDYIWPRAYFVLFLCYYLTPQTDLQRRNVALGMINGLILGYLVIQGHSFLFRPYDDIVYGPEINARYRGNFCNPNHNCAFLCFCLAGILAKILYRTRFGYFCLAGSCYGFIFMTGGRSGYLTAIVLTLVFLAAYCRVSGRRLFLRMGALMVSLFVIMLPVSYLAARYLPTIHPHVLFYFQEGYSEERVHSQDAWDSEKYISFGEMLEEVLGRVAQLFAEEEECENVAMRLNREREPIETAAGGLSWEREESGAALEALSRSGPDSEKPEGATGAEKERKSDRIPLLPDEENTLLVRRTIYKWFWGHLSLRGMPYSEQGFQLTPNRWIQHAHNIYLEYGINFGYPVMILFGIFVWWGIVKLYREGMGRRRFPAGEEAEQKIKKQKADLEKVTCLLLILIPAVFGLFEYIWGAGTLSSVMLYLAFREILVKPVPAPEQKAQSPAEA